MNVPPAIIEQVVEGITDNFPECAICLRCTGWHYNERQFEFFDDETGKTHQLDKAKLLATFPLILSDKWPRGCTPPPTTTDWEAWENWLCQSDANDFDCFAQLACFGEVIYG